MGNPRAAGSRWWYLLLLIPVVGLMATPIYTRTTPEQFGFLFTLLFLPQKDATNLQPLGGVWIIQTLPVVIVGLLTRWFDRRALLCGWLAGMVAGTWIAASQSLTPTWQGTILGVNINAYTAIWSLLLNLVVAVVLTAVFRGAGRADNYDETTPADYDERIETGRAAPVAAAPTG